MIVLKKCLVAASLFVIGLSSASANLVTNGDFEGGSFDGWTTFTTTNGTISPSITISPNSTFAATFRVGQVVYENAYQRAFQGGGILQSFLADTGEIDISVDIAAFASQRNAEAGRFQLLLDSVSVASFDFGEAYTNNNLMTSSLTYSGFVSAGSHELSILIDRDFLAPPDLYQYVDNISVVQATKVPEPVPTALLGIGLAALAFSRRKNR